MISGPPPCLLYADSDSEVVTPVDGVGTAESAADVLVSLSLLTFEGSVEQQLAVILVDCGSETNAVSQKFVEEIGILTTKADRATVVVYADGQECVVDQTACLTVQLGHYSQKLNFLVVPDCKYQAILGKPWLVQHNPVIDWKLNSLKFMFQGEVVLLEQPEASHTTPIKLIVSGQLNRESDVVLEDNPPLGLSHPTCSFLKRMVVSVLALIVALVSTAMEGRKPMAAVVSQYLAPVF